MLLTLTPECRRCKRSFRLEVELEQYEKWIFGGALIQNCFIDMPVDERELLMSGICGECFDKLFTPVEGAL